LVRWRDCRHPPDPPTGLRNPIGELRHADAGAAQRHGFISGLQ